MDQRPGFCKHVKVCPGDPEERVVKLPCGNHARDGADFCYVHDPKTKRRRDESAARVSVLMRAR